MKNLFKFIKTYLRANFRMWEVSTSHILFVYPEMKVKHVDFPDINHTITDFVVKLKYSIVGDEIFFNKPQVSRLSFSSADISEGGYLYFHSHAYSDKDEHGFHNFCTGDTSVENLLVVEDEDAFVNLMNFLYAMFSSEHRVSTTFSIKSLKSSEGLSSTMFDIRYMLESITNIDKLNVSMNNVKSRFLSTTIAIDDIPTILKDALIIDDGYTQSTIKKRLSESNIDINLYKVKIGKKVIVPTFNVKTADLDGNIEVVYRNSIVKAIDILAKLKMYEQIEKGNIGKKVIVKKLKLKIRG